MVGGRASGTSEQPRLQRRTGAVCGLATMVHRQMRYLIPDSKKGAFVADGPNLEEERRGDLAGGACSKGGSGP